MPVSERWNLLSVLNSRDLTLLYQSLDPAQAEQIAPLLQWPEGALSRILNLVVENVQAVKETQVVLRPRCGEPRWRCVFSPPFYRWIALSRSACVPDADGLSAEAIIRWVLLVKCFGQTRSRSVVRDTLIQELAGVPSSFLSRERLVRWQRKITVKQLDGLLADVAQWRWHNRTVGGRVCILATVETNGQSRGHA